MAIKCRPARQEETEALSALCVRSKAHWGYDSRFMELAQRTLQIDPAAISEGRAFVAADASDCPLGVVAVALCANGVDLTHLFVDPGALGQGVGEALFTAALEWTRQQERAALMIASDPNATSSYERMGAVCIGTTPSDSIPGRSLPLLRRAVSR